MRAPIILPPVKGIDSNGKLVRYSSFYEAYCAIYGKENHGKQIPSPDSPAFGAWEKDARAKESRLELMKRPKPLGGNPNRFIGSASP
jgi:hypothetical protein